MKMLPLEDILCTRLLDNPKQFAFRSIDDKRCKPKFFDIPVRLKIKKYERSWNDKIATTIYEKHISDFNPIGCADYIYHQLHQYCIATMKIYKPIINKTYARECAENTLEHKIGVVIHSIDIVCPTIPRLSWKTYFDKKRINSSVERHYAVRGFKYISRFVERYNDSSPDLKRLVSLRITVK